MKKEYCRYCGRLKQSISTGLYNQDNGEIEYKLVCSTIGCKRYCIDRGGHKYESLFWSFLFGNNICTVCGKEYRRS